jgi:hypothetical protein
VGYFCADKNAVVTTVNCLTLPFVSDCPVSPDGSGWTISYSPVDFSSGVAIQHKYCTLNSAINRFKTQGMGYVVAPHQLGSIGIKHALNDIVNNTCTNLQSQTATPAITPATIVNGAFVCPTGKTLSGTDCI